jgi:hypothetical protein
MPIDPHAEISGQLCDPGREKQIEENQAPSGQTGVQCGRIDYVEADGAPQY